ncbi:MAG: hypothetical protein IKP40_09935 [Clostridia bacterium]|nr:hypothetical protein [Clostridia bacterium]
MITSVTKNKVDNFWTDICAGGITKRLDQFCPIPPREKLPFLQRFKIGFSSKHPFENTLTVRPVSSNPATYESKGRGFESRRAHENPQILANQGFAGFTLR